MITHLTHLRYGLTKQHFRNYSSTEVSELKYSEFESSSPDSCHLMRSRFFLALTVLLICDTVLKFSWSPSSQQLLENSNHSPMWWALRDFYEHPNADVILLGSSLMQQIVCDGDATYLNRSVDSLNHHECAHLEDRLKAKAKNAVKTFAFSVPGEFASDAAVVTSLILKSDHHPSRIIYGIAPRDFMDNSLSSPSSTESFRLMSKLFPKHARERRAYSSDMEHCEALVDSFLLSVSGIYKSRIGLTYATRTMFRNFSNFTLSAYRDNSAQQISLHDRRLVPEERCLGQQVVYPERGTPMYFDNRNQYICSYQPFRPRIYNAQISYFTDMLKRLQENSVGVTIVNMPITQDNMDLMVPGFYEGYLRDVKAITQANGAEFIDLNKPGLFAKRHFKDTVHLNGYGAIRFGELLTENLRPSTIASLSRPESNHIARSKSSM